MSEKIGSVFYNQTLLNNLNLVCSDCFTASLHANHCLAPAESFICCCLDASITHIIDLSFDILVQKKGLRLRQCEGIRQSPASCWIVVTTQTTSCLIHKLGSDFPILLNWFSVLLLCRIVMSAIICSNGMISRYTWVHVFACPCCLL